MSMVTGIADDLRKLRERLRNGTTLYVAETDCTLLNQAADIIEEISVYDGLIKEMGGLNMRLIDADRLKMEIAAVTIKNNYSADKANALCKIIDSQPSIDAEPVRHGKWFLEKYPDGPDRCYHCSICDDDFHNIGITMAYDYCPNCGAKMQQDIIFEK